ncbi:MAG: hypothetical protein HY782_25770 [Chloroflexi bacterium]|nr:hypothetical protein [Chloroflexota bacterium]
MDENHHDVTDTDDGKKAAEGDAFERKQAALPKRILAQRRLVTGEVYYVVDRVTGKRLRWLRWD